MDIFVPSFRPLWGLSVSTGVIAGLWLLYHILFQNLSSIFLKKIKKCKKHHTKRPLNFTMQALFWRAILICGRRPLQPDKDIQAPARTLIVGVMAKSFCYFFHNIMIIVYVDTICRGQGPGTGGQGSGTGGQGSGTFFICTLVQIRKNSSILSVWASQRQSS